MTPFTYFTMEKTGARTVSSPTGWNTYTVDVYSRRYYHGALNLKKVQCAVWRRDDKDDEPYVEVTLDQGTAAVFSVAIDEAERLFKTKFGPVEGPRKD